MLASRLPARPEIARIRNIDAVMLAGTDAAESLDQTQRLVLMTGLAVRDLPDGYLVAHLREDLPARGR